MEAKPPPGILLRLQKPIKLTSATLIRRVKNDFLAVDAHASVSAILNEFELRTDSSSPTAGWSLAPHLAEIDHHFGRDSVQQILDSLAASSPSSPFASIQLAKMLAASPTSLAVSLRQLRRCRLLGDSLARALRLEYRLAVRLVDGDADGDFIEGVRAALEDKGRGESPKWQPASVAELTEAQLAAYFAPLPNGEELALRLPNGESCGVEVDSDWDWPDGCDARL